MLLVVDIGNTNLVLGVYQEKKLKCHWRLATRLDQTGDEYAISIANLFHLADMPLKTVTGVIVASVVPPIQSVVIRALKRSLDVPILIVGPGLKTSMPIRYDNPRDVGADRIVNAVAAYERVGGAVVVVDFGTATTFDLVGPQGDYLGGAIAPGLGLSMDALFEKTAKLPRIELIRPKKVVGRDTVSSMQSGLYWGYVGLVDSLIDRIIDESGFDPVEVVATGGLARLMAAESKKIEVIDEFLTLDGLRLLYERNI